MILEIKDLHVTLDGKEILKGINLKVKQGEMHVIMGPNASGKSTLTKTIMGHPKYKVTGGDILIDGKSILPLTTDKRAKQGLFLLFQNPVEIEGVGYISFLHSAKDALAEKPESMKVFMSEIKANITKLKLGDGFIGRSLNHGFSGGEKKKAEMLQLKMLKPKMAILDEPDSGLDIDAVKLVSSEINEISQTDHCGFIIITHYNRILSYVKPDHVHVLVNGKLVASGGRDLAEQLERKGYDSYIKQQEEIDG